MERHSGDAWLSLTPEPERDLPAAIATLRAGGHPTAAQVEAERAQAERLVLRGSRRRWVTWLREAAALAEEPGSSRAASAEVTAARELVLAVINNHDALELGLPGRRRAPSNGAEGETFEQIRNRNEIKEKGP